MTWSVKSEKVTCSINEPTHRGRLIFHDINKHKVRIRIVHTHRSHPQEATKCEDSRHRRMGVIGDVDRNEPKGQGGIGATFWQDGMLVSERTKRRSSEVEKLTRTRERRTVKMRPGELGRELTSPSAADAGAGTDVDADVGAGAVAVAGAGAGAAGAGVDAAGAGAGAQQRHFWASGEELALS